jgi:tetratricopeptide (TPR) repeat protein
MSGGYELRGNVSESGAPRYVAYISYQHGDSKIARWLHRAIEGYRVPHRRLASAQPQLRSRLRPVFIDRDELSSSADLGETLRKALDDSDFLIVVCSPLAAASRWVNQEIQDFKDQGKAAKILCLVAAGEPFAARRGFAPSLECYPPALLGTAVEGQSTAEPTAEPLAADVRPEGDTRHNAKLKIIAALLGVRFDDLRHRDHVRQRTRLAAISLAGVVGSVAFASLAIAALVARHEAVKQRQLAVRHSQTAERTTDFLISLFQVSNPTESRGNSVTARAILDRGAAQIEGSLRDEPAVRATLSTTLGEVYAGLGLYKPAIDLLERAHSTEVQDSAARARATTALAFVEHLRGNDEKADALYVEAQHLADTLDPPDRALQTRILMGRGEVAGYQEKLVPAIDFFRRASALQKGQPPNELQVRILEQLATAEANNNELAASEPLFEQALQERTAFSGETHPMVPETLNNLGAVAYLRGENDRAESFYKRALAVDTRVLGKEHPDVAVDMNNLALIYVERRDFARAIPMLEEAVRVQLAQQDETQRDLIFAFTNLGLARMGKGDYDAAATAFDKGLKAAIANKSRMHAPILVDIADLECRRSHFDAGLARIESARPLMAERYPDDPWRMALLENVKAECLTGQRKFVEADALLSASIPVLLKKWGPLTLYGNDALRRAINLYQLTGDPAKTAKYRRLAAA